MPLLTPEYEGMGLGQLIPAWDSGEKVERSAHPKPRKQPRSSEGLPVVLHDTIDGGCERANEQDSEQTAGDEELGLVDALAFQEPIGSCRRNGKASHDERRNHPVHSSHHPDFFVLDPLFSAGHLSTAVSIPSIEPENQHDEGRQQEASHEEVHAVDPITFPVKAQ